MAKSQSKQNKAKTVGRYVSAENRGRVTARRSVGADHSPHWYAWLLIDLLIFGMLVITLNYLQVLPGSTSSWYGARLDVQRVLPRDPIPLTTKPPWRTTGAVGRLLAETLDDRGVGESAALAHRDQSVAAAGALELVEQGRHELGA